MQSVFLPDYKFIERCKLVSESAVSIEPFLNFSVGLQVFNPCKDMAELLGFKIPFEFTASASIFSTPLSIEFAAKVHNQFTKWANRLYN